MHKHLFGSTLVRISAVIVPGILFFTALCAMAASVSLQWDPNNPPPDGYRVFARKSGQAYNYRQPDWEGTTVNCTIINLEDYTDYYFVVRAYEGSQESADSEEVHYIPAVTDNDGDGLPDGWEADFGLNPNIDDAEGDLDRDGISNSDEYRAGLEPDDPGEGAAPHPPEPLFPESLAQVSCNPLLELEAYSDADGDAHIGTQWQIYDTRSGDCLLDVISDRRLTELRVPMLLLNGGVDYHWRVRFFDSGGKASSWSINSHFTTETAENDFNGNGIDDDQEVGMIQADESRSLTSPAVTYAPTDIVAASEDTIAEIEQAVVLDPVDFEIDETTPARLPFAMLAYKLMLYQPGQRALVTIHLSNAAPVGTPWIKYDAVNGWQDYSHHAVFSADGQSVTIEVKDGGYGDADGVANGIIIDPSGLSVPDDAASVTAASGGGGGGGCFIATLQGTGPSRVDAGSGIWQWLKQSIGRCMAVVNG